MRCRIYTDGASRGNPGRAAWAYLILRDGREVWADCGYMGRATNNTAEYRAVIHALEKAAELGCTEVEVFSDSQLVVRQLTGRYAVRKEHLRKLHSRVLKLAESFRRVSFREVRRSDRYVKRCDAMCSEVLGAGAQPK